jgi:AmmeMemoRadiSam system protein B
MSPAHVLVRPPAVAGTFYPADRGALRAAIQRSFDGAARPPVGTPPPKAIVVPHAGYVYSGPVAASAYLRIEPVRASIRRVVLLGPSHRVPLRGVALSSADVWATPLGDVPIDTRAASLLSDFPLVGVNDMAHRHEHSLEVQLPFLQTVLDDFDLVPLVVGFASPDEVASVIEALWTGADTLVVVSTDLSHYHDYDDAVCLDTRTAAAIAALRSEHITDDAACGARPLRGLLRVAAGRHLSIEQLDLRNSGDTAGDRRSVVGYGAFAIR